MGTADENLKVISGVSLDDKISAFALSKHLVVIDRAIVEIGGVRLLVWDPITEFLDIKDDNRAGPTRAALAPLQTLAEKHGLCVLLLSHMNKNEATRIIYRTTGSQSYVNLPRSVWSMGKDPANENRRIFQQVKQNLTSAQPGFAFSITEEKGVVLEEKRVKIIDGEIFGTDEQRYERSQTEEAKNFLIETLQNGPTGALEIFKNARLAGLSEITIRRAKSALGIIAFQSFKAGKHFWAWKLKK